MEIKINCEKVVSLNRMIRLIEINAKILSSKLDNQTLNGDTLIYGKYIMEDIKNKKEKEVEFEEIVPFTIVFSRENIKIEEVDIENFKYTVNGNEIATKFEIEIEYSFKDDAVEVPIVPSYDLEIDEEEIKEEKDDDDKSLEITESINKKIDNFFSPRDEEEDEEEIEEEVKEEPKEEPKEESTDICYKNDESEKEKLNHYMKDEKYSKVSIYFTTQNTDIEKISKIENVGIDKLYNDNSDYLKNNRIIVNK